MKPIALSGKRLFSERLKTCGMPRDVFRQPPFDPRHHTLSVRSENEGYRTRLVKKAVQLKHLEALLANPFGGNNYLYVIASNPSDAKAKLTAAAILERALVLHDKKEAPRGRSYPKWHRVYGNYTDDLRDQKKHGADHLVAPSLLVLSNVMIDSTPAKLELVRDLLDMYDDTPRILVVTGSDPLTFVDRRLRMRISYCLNLSTAHKQTL